MVVRVIIAAVLSAVLMFVWGFLFWVQLHATTRLMSPLPADKELDVVAPLRGAKMPDGMYVYPGPADMSDQAAMDAWQKKMAEGPLFQMAYRSGGSSPMDAKTLALGFIHNLVIALLAGLTLAMVAGSLPGFFSRFGLLAMVSVIASIWTNWGDVIWWLHPVNYATGNTVYELVAGLLMSGVTAAIVRPTLQTRSVAP